MSTRSRGSRCRSTTPAGASSTGSAQLRLSGAIVQPVAGLQLARPAAAITVADIVEAVEGPIALTACIEGTDCSVEHECLVKPHWPVVNEALRGALAAIPLTQLAREREIA